MTQRIFAWSLFVLALSPFTAPFSTCDLATLFGYGTAVALDAPVVQAATRTAGTSLDDAALAVPLLATISLLKLPIPIIARPGSRPASTSDGPNPVNRWVFGPILLRGGRPILSTILRL